MDRLLANDSFSALALDDHGAFLELEADGWREILAQEGRSLAIYMPLLCGSDH